jgi:hypothetical protein
MRYLLADSPEYTVRDLFEAFVYLRRQGATPDYALQELKRLRPTISVTERGELANMIRQWEKTEGLHHRPNPEAKIQPPPPPPPPSPPPTKVACPECKTLNPTDARYCFSCGTLLTRVGTQQLFAEDEGTEGTSFGNLSSLIFTVRGFEDKPIRVNLEEFQEVIVGRTGPDSVIMPDVDLTDYNARDLGVSRVHGTLKRKDSVVTLSDMGSVNHTYLNGERIFPQEIRVLRDGDEIRLGRLVMRVTFQRELKRIKS